VVILKPQRFRTPRAGRGIRPCRARHYDALVLACLGVTVTFLFAVTPLDIDAARIFYSADVSDHWPLAAKLPWSVLYRLAPWITASLVLVGLAGLIAGFACRRAAWRWQAVFVLLSVLLGPGLIINGIFKDHWDRPRPRDVVQFGGPMPYVIAPMRGQGGASFPCGHCSVGFLYGVTRTRTGARALLLRAAHSFSASTRSQRRGTRSKSGTAERPVHTRGLRWHSRPSGALCYSPWRTTGRRNSFVIICARTESTRRAGESG
jgi:hypothetical protein